VLKRKANLTGLQRSLRDLLRYSTLQPQDGASVSAQGKGQEFWEYQSPTWAAKFLDDAVRE
jgi:hypothetical protein